jgi:hypothetical protein
VDQVKLEEFKVNNTPIRMSNPLYRMMSTYVSSAKFKVEPFRELEKTEQIPRSYSTSFVSIESFYVSLKSVSK